LLAGARDVVVRAIRHRRMLGGAMRQVGIFAAAGIFALDNNMTRLVEDHANARLIADRLAKSHRIAIDLATVQTNILVFGLAPDAPDAMTLVAKARERGVLLNAFGPRTLRAVTHLDVSRDECMRAADVLVELASSSPA
jgi:threonine aldolase